MATREKGLTLHQKMMLGAFGALTPSLLNLYASDIGAMLESPPTTPYLVGYIVRILILMLYGALIAFFHKKENSAVKVFQLGAAAPALITIMLGIGKQDNKQLDKTEFFDKTETHCTHQCYAEQLNQTLKTVSIVRENIVAEISNMNQLTKAVKIEFDNKKISIKNISDRQQSYCYQEARALI